MEQLLRDRLWFPEMFLGGSWSPEDIEDTISGINNDEASEPSIGSSGNTRQEGQDENKRTNDEDQVYHRAGRCSAREPSQAFPTVATRAMTERLELWTYDGEVSEAEDVTEEQEIQEEDLHGNQSGKRYLAGQEPAEQSVNTADGFEGFDSRVDMTSTPSRTARLRILSSELYKAAAEEDQVECDCSGAVTECTSEDYVCDSCRALQRSVDSSD